jgi:DNA-binding MarR family transcriptional regulator
VTSTDTPTLSDYAWRIMRYLAADSRAPEATAREIADLGNIGETDRLFIFGQLVECERRGLVERSREDIGKPWWWKLTRNGRAALARHEREESRR